MLFTYFVFDVSAIDATPDWNSIENFMIHTEDGPYTTAYKWYQFTDIPANDVFWVNIPLVGEDWQVDPAKPIEIRIFLLMNKASNNYNPDSKKINAVWGSDSINGENNVKIASHDFTEYSYGVNFGNTNWLTTTLSGGVDPLYGMYQGRGFYIDVVINANAFDLDASCKSIQLEMRKFTTTTTTNSALLWTPYIGIRNIIPGTLEYLEQILQAIIDLQSNGGISAADAKQAIIEAIEETLMSTPAQNAAAQALASEIADKVLAGEDVLEELQELNRPDPDEIGNVADLDQVISSDDIEEYTTVFEAIMQSNIVLSMLLACCTIALISLVLYGKKA